MTAKLFMKLTKADFRALHLNFNNYLKYHDGKPHRGTSRNLF
ncbi:unnamed protein product [Tenebrio molitor]|nr:unnamed protein product [Tenebrio molitor]